MLRCQILRPLKCLSRQALNDTIYYNVLYMSQFTIKFSTGVTKPPEEVLNIFFCFFQCVFPFCKLKFGYTLPRYSQVSNTRGGSNKRVCWIFFFKFKKQVGSNNCMYAEQGVASVHHLVDALQFQTGVSEIKSILI